MQLVGYIQPDKGKSSLVLVALCKGSGGRVVKYAKELEPGPAAFFGVVGLEGVFEGARARGDFYYGDNAYFDRHRNAFFRFTKDALQPSVMGRGIPGRAKSQGIELQPWQKDGRHVVVVEQSPHYLKLSGAGENWLAETLATLRSYTDRELRVRLWSRDKASALATLANDLKGAHALVTQSSAAAIEGLIAGIPAFTTMQCAASPVGLGNLTLVESPIYPDRHEWIDWVASNHWTLDEMRRGETWRWLNGG